MVAGAVIAQVAGTGGAERSGAAGAAPPATIPPRSARQIYQERRATELDDRIALGKRLFFDTSLSSPAGQSCASCHSPSSAFSDPDHSRPVSLGVLPGRIGTRNAPAIAYNCFSPAFGFDWTDKAFFGGMFLDGRVADLPTQAGEPLLNPAEMHNSSKAEVVQKVIDSGAAGDLLRLYPLAPAELMGLAEDKSSAGYAAAVEAVYTRIGQAITAYEISNEVNPRTSKYDAYITGEAELSEQELRGMNLFFGQACCSECHVSTGRRRLASDYGGAAPAPRDRYARNTLFTDYGYENIGIPAVPVDLLGAKGGSSPQPDPGLGGTMQRGGMGAASAYWEQGKFKTPTLRNIEKSAPYGHNGYFQTLRDIVHFYNTRDVPGAGPIGEGGSGKSEGGSSSKPAWPAPEVLHNVNRERMGDLKLTDSQEEDLVAFLKTLTDGYK
jgi:cytochrome c peroxidase